MLKTVKEQKMDAEWIQLIKEAKTMGITREEIRTFLLNNQQKQ